MALLAGVVSVDAAGGWVAWKIGKLLLRTIAPEVPVAVIVYSPAATPVVFTVIVLAPGGVIGFTLKPTVPGAGRPVELSVTLLLKPRMVPIEIERSIWVLPHTDSSAVGIDTVNPGSAAQLLHTSAKS